jgi:hypothetical protein
MKKTANRTFSSFDELGAAMGIEKSEKTFSKKCPKCGTRMNQIPGTNVFFCPGETDDGTCGKRVISNLRPAY